jgi:tetratricopeptide (TPR) repeat protein
MSPSQLRTALLVIATPLALSVATDARAWTIDQKTAAMLPDYCKYTLIYRKSEYGSRDPAQIRRWEQLMGRDNFMHMHHYCRGLQHVKHALYLERTKHGRDQQLGFSIREFDYVIRNVKPGFAMLPEIRTKRAESLLRLGREPEAVVELGRAIELKPDYWPPYAALSDHYRGQRDVEQARLWLEKGLAARPDALPLKRRLAELGTPDPRRKTSAQ